jgi:hypothetical protein
MESGKMYRMDWSNGFQMVEIGKKVLEVGQRVYGFLGYGGSERGKFIVTSAPDIHGRQKMAEIGGWHRFAYWRVGQDDQPLSKKFGIGYYWDDKEPDYRMPEQEIAKLVHQCEVQQAWNERLERNKQIASRKRTEQLRKEYGSILTECNSYDDKTAKQNMLVLLKRAFPGVKFYCRKNGSSSYCVRWTDGPTEKMVGKICSMFADTTFNGYQDIEENIGDEFTALYGGIGYTPDLERSYSDKVWNEAKEKFYEKHPEAVGVNEHSQFLPKSYSEFVESNQYTSASSCLRGYLSDIDFYQKPEEKPVSSTAKAVENKSDLQIVDYSEKAVAIIGNTRDYVEKLKELGGRFNGKLKCGAGWVFSKKREPELRAAFSL